MKGFKERFIPLHHYYIAALDLMWTHLTNDKPLPHSQVVHTIPRGNPGGLTPDISLKNLPEIKAITDKNAQITVSDRKVYISE